MFHRIYFQNPIARIENLTKLTELLKADIFLTISKTVAADLARNFGIDPDRIHSIDGGPINHGLRPEAVPVKKPFILMPTGNDLRKNNRAAILGFGEFNTRHNNAYHLVITSFFDPAEMEELSKLAGNITFTGNVTGNGLAYLYETCDALLFPSKYEGLGLPVLEAVEKDKPVACSDISVFKEMSDTAFAYFDPALGTSIAKALDVAVSLKLDRQTYKRIKTEYTWQSTADKAVKAIRQHEHDNPIADKPEVAVFGLSAECNSPSAGFMQVTHAELSRFVTPRYFLEGTGGGQPAEPDVLAFLAGSQSVSTKSRVSLGDQLPIYNLFNSEHLVMTLFTALARPGVLVLHEPGLEQTWEAMARQGLVDRSRLEAEKNLQEKSGATGVNLLGSAVAAQKRIAVFSDKAATAINDLQKALGISVPVVMLPVPQNGKHGHRAFAKALSQVILEIAGGGHE